VVLGEKHRSFQITSVELVWDTEANGSVLPSLPHDRMQVADREDHVLPLLVWLNSLKEVTVDHRLVGSGDTSLESSWRLDTDFDSYAQQTERELLVRLTSQEQSKLWVNLDVLGLKDVFKLGHELKTQMAVVQDDPEAVAESIENECLGLNLLFFSH
jgi:hypothetical protein